MARAKHLAELIDRTLGPTLAQRGFANVEILLAWPEIVGEAMAARSRPERLVWPKRREGERNQAATLLVRVEPGFALELQHLAPVILDRLATFFGWRCVERLKFEQARIPAAPPAPAPSPAPSPAVRREARERAEGIEDENLRTAVERLGTAVLGRTRA
jgi:hypothetical protein